MFSFRLAENSAAGIGVMNRVANLLEGNPRGDDEPMDQNQQTEGDYSSAKHNDESRVNQGYSGQEGSLCFIE